MVDTLGLGGTQTVVKGIFEKQKNNSNIFLYALRKRDINIEIDHQNVFTYDSKNKFSFPLFKLRKFIKENNIEILHCHLAKSQIMGGVLKTLFFPNIKLVLHEHGAIFNDGKIYPFFMNLFKNKVNLYIAVSNAIKKAILQKTKYDNNKVKVLYNFVDLDKFKKIENFDIETERKKYSLDKNDFVIGFASRLNEAKGWKEFVNSAKNLIKKGYDIKFLVAGDGPDKEKLLEEIKGISNIQYIGYVNNMVSFYNILDCFVFPSHREALPMTILEVNGIGIPLVASNISGINEIMMDNKNSLLFEKQNVEDLIKSIIKLYEDLNLRNDLIKNGLEEVRKYSLEKYLVELNNLYNNL
ncbi:glycosyltransferase [Candidatus Vampirococcus lugosii]|nr:glycosyltransferase [Candidatus Vampirococcus lugosii]